MTSGLISTTQAHSVIVLENSYNTHNPDTWGFKEGLLPKIYMCMHVCLYNAQILGSSDEDIQRRNLMVHGPAKVLLYQPPEATVDNCTTTTAEA